MGISSHTFWLARRGHSPEEYEDAFAADVAAGRFAVADGATESCFAGLWARLLVEEFVHGGECDPDQWPARLSALRERWLADVSGRSLSWYAEAGIEKGAFAAFLGVAVDVSADASWRWRAIAVGDSCLFRTRGADLLSEFPIGRSRQFNNVPTLLGSQTPPEKTRQQRILWSRGSGRPNERLWMMSDALAQWCLVQHEEERNPWEEMESLLTRPEPEESFASWIEQLRDTRGLHNDDVTLLLVNL